MATKLHCAFRSFFYIFFRVDNLIETCLLKMQTLGAISGELPESVYLLLVEHPQTSDLHCDCDAILFLK